ncbi:Uncharacterized protein APZ42_027533 [Daphnia magna]|uniref:Endonuclease/exonuclease/phosphatase domain-containing protein n=1 Tax=Daphnia magna TaxID=35525 RepID=A0A164R9X5_9CRUS|nr:Uncharacterized protein APZ42_027533 [Daphnia magna]
MAVKWQNCVDIDFGVQFPRLSMRAVHGFVRSFKVEPQDVLGLVAVLEKRNLVARITFTTEAYTRSFLSKHSGIVRTELEGKEVNVVIRDSNIEERFVRIAGIPNNLDLGVVQTRLQEYGTVIDTLLATWMIVRMTLTKNIPSYVNIGSYRSLVKYEGQQPTCRLCDDENHFSNNCPTLRRNKEASNAKKSRGAQNSHVEEAANTELTVAIQENAVLLTEPSEGVSLELSSEGNEAMETDNLTALNELASPDIPPGQFLPTQAVIIPETQSLGIPIPSVSTMDSTVPDTENVVSIVSDTDNASLTSNDYQTKTKRARTKYLPTITDKNSRPGKSSQIPLPPFLVKHGLDHSRLLLDPDGRLISIDFNSFTVINIYAPSGKQAKEERNNFLRRTIPAYASTTRLPLVLIGDFNCVDDIEDRKQTKSQSYPSKIINLALKEMIEGLELIDIWKKLKKTEPGHTFHHHGCSFRLDRIYAIDTVFLYMQSQHPSSCKIYCWLMENECFDFCPEIRRIVIAYRKQRAKRIRETKMFYQSCMQEMAQADTFDWVAFQKLRNFSKSWEESTLKGFGVRSRGFEGEENEGATIFHVSRARENFRRCRIEKIIAPNGECLTTKEDVSKEIVSHFTSIFKSQSFPDMLAGTGFLEGVRVCCRVYPNLTVPISSFEIKSALIQTKKNKSPGNDGIPYEFYVAFWDEIAPHFLDMFNHILERGTLTSSQGQAAIRLIPKLIAGRVLEIFCQWTNARMNKQKTKALGLGRDSRQGLESCIWSFAGYSAGECLSSIHSPSESEFSQGEGCLHLRYMEEKES